MNCYTVDLDTVYGRTNVYDFPKAAVVDMSNHTGARWKYWYELLKKKKKSTDDSFISHSIFGHFGPSYLHQLLASF